jgi:hypothetical protein
MFSTSRRLPPSHPGSSTLTLGGDRLTGRMGHVGLVALIALLAACGSNGPGGTQLPCATDEECPNELVCDTEAGVCVDGEDPFTCQPALPGCPCSDGDEPVPCLIDGLLDGLVGSCREGQTSCENGVYGACVETSDLFCGEVGVGPSDFDLDEQDSDQVVTGPEGELVLDPDVQQVEFGYLWIANTGENTVSKIDIEDGREVARYASVRGSAGLGVPAVPPGGFGGDQSNCGNCPSRTAIDYHGDAFVANRAFGLQGTVTKYANDFADCVDGNGNGVIDTSVDVDTDGRIDVDDPGEFLGESDECILWTAPVGNNGGVPRALAIDAGGVDGEDGNLWIGLYEEGRVVQISGETGAPVDNGNGPVSVSLTTGGSSTRPYGCAVDGLGNLWVTGLSDGDQTYLSKVDTFGATLEAMYGMPDDDDGCSQGYGISVDTSQRVWLGGWDCRDLKAFDQTTEEWHRVDFDQYSNTRGVATDTAGNAWVAFTDGQVGKVRVDDIITLGAAAPVELFDIPELAGNGPIDSTIGVGIDRNGACWAVSRNDNAPLGTATRIDVGGNVESFPVGHRPYTYSDFTGFGLTTVVRPNGFWRGVIEGCATGDQLTDWRVLDWSENEPPGTTVRMRVRVSDTYAGLDAAAWYGPWDEGPIDLDVEGVPDGIFMQVEVQLSTEDPAVTPSFIGFNVEFFCPGWPPIE